MWRTIGNEKARRILERGLDEDRLSHAYLLSGPSGVGKMTLAVETAQAVNCLGKARPCGECVQCVRIERGLHADMRIVGVDTDGSDDGRRRVVISIDQVREVQREAGLKPYEGRSRVFVFDGAEHLSEEAANCLLKTLEEPPDQVLLMLLTADHGALLPTLVSRCQLLELRPVPARELAQTLQSTYGTDESRALEIARLSGGMPGWAIQAVSQPGPLEELAEKLETIERVVRSGLEERFSYAADLATSFGRDRETVRRELGLWLEWWRDLLMVKTGVPDYATNLSLLDRLQELAGSVTTVQLVRVLRAIRETSEYLERNVNPRLALEGMMLTLPPSPKGRAISSTDTTDVS